MINIPERFWDNLINKKLSTIVLRKDILEVLNIGNKETIELLDNKKYYIYYDFDDIYNQPKDDYKKYYIYIYFYIITSNERVIILDNSFILNDLILSIECYLNKIKDICEYLSNEELEQLRFSLRSSSLNKLNKDKFKVYIKNTIIRQLMIVSLLYLAIEIQEDKKNIEFNSDLN